MEEFLRKIKLIDSFSISLNTNKNDFVFALRKNIDEDDIDSIFSSAFEIFSSSKNIFKGKEPVTPKIIDTVIMYKWKTFVLRIEDERIV